MKKHLCLATFVLLALPLAAGAQDVMVQVTNNQSEGGFSFSPLWAAFHDGTFDAFDSGSAASADIEALAELADSSGLSASLGASGVDAVVPSPNAPPPFTPGETGALPMNVGDPMVNRYFSFGAMVVPSNDFFLGNDDPMAWEVFDADGNFLGPITIEIYGEDLWDAGTEVNDVNNGIAFIVGQDATQGADEGGVVTPLFDVPGIDGYLTSLLGQQTPIGPITDPLICSELVATINIVPEPTTLFGFATLGLLATALRRR